MLIYDHCKNCKYLIIYYVKTDFHFRPARGMCARSKRSTYLLKPLELCDYREEKEDEETFERIKKSAEEAINEINVKLYEILEVLKLEKIDN